MCTRLAFRSYGRFHWQKHICSSRHVTSKTSFFVQCVHGLMTTSPHPAVRCEAADLLAVLTQTDQTFKVNVCPDLCSRMNEQCASNYSADHRAIVLILCSTVKHFIISFYLFVFFFYSLGWIFCFCACLYAVACVQWLWQTKVMLFSSQEVELCYLELTNNKSVCVQIKKVALKRFDDIRRKLMNESRNSTVVETSEISGKIKKRNLWTIII